MCACLLGSHHFVLRLSLRRNVPPVRLAFERLSPVAASAKILAHIREAWNYRVAGGEDDLRLEHQDILLTVPASFDAVARDLTVRAAETAGLARITLIEEPMAAFYAWIESAGDRWRKEVQPGDMVLVCDIGGGTSDFSLIRVWEEDGNLALDRIAVGEIGWQSVLVPATTSHSSGTLLALQSSLVTPAMSWSSGTPLPLQSSHSSGMSFPFMSWLVPPATSHSSGT